MGREGKAAFNVLLTWQVFNLIKQNFVTGAVAGEGYGYLKSYMWWTGMILSKTIYLLAVFPAYSYCLETKSDCRRTM